MTLELLMPQPQHEGVMYRHPSPAQNYSPCNYNQTPTTQYQLEYPTGNSFQSTGTADSQPPPTTNSWVSAGFPMSGVPHVDWGLSQDPYTGNTFSGQTQVGPVSSQYTEELDFYQGFGPSTTAVSSVSQALHRPAMRSPYHDWMRSTSYRINPQTGKTRTKDKYRVVYSDHQRLELEKEFHYSRYITIRRKAELAVSLGLSERQVKIWFQNRRAKERKHNKKRIAMEEAGDQNELDQSSDEKRDVGLVEIKKEKVLDGELLDPLGRELHHQRRSPPTTPEVLEIGGTPGNTQLELSEHRQVHSTGACQLQPVHVAVTASLFHAMAPMHMK